MLRNCSGVVDMMVAHVPPSRKATADKVAAHYSGPLDAPAVSFMVACNPRGPLIVAVDKLFPRQDCSRFDALGRIMSGTLRPGDQVKVRGMMKNLGDEIGGP